MSDTHPNVQIAANLTACLLRGDVAGIDALYTDDAKVWRNFDGRELSKAQILKVVAFLANGVTELNYEVSRVQPTDTGFVQQHTLQCVAKNGEKVNAPACLVATVVDGKISRLEEYLDSNALKALMG